VALAWLGAALLVATAVPVARVFVLGPGSGRTAALAAPIMAFAPAVVGFAMLGLASRTLLAQHDGRAAGLTTASAWAVVILAVLSVRPFVRPESLVPAAAASVSLGMIVGAVVGWLLIRRSHRGAAALGLTQPMLAAAVSSHELSMPRTNGPDEVIRRPIRNRVP
jgi:putative peptidoglycan lipid II flippase